VNVARHVSLVVRRRGQIGCAGSESVIVTAGVLVASVAVAGGKFLEIAVQFFFVPMLPNLLEYEEGGANDDGNSD